MISSLQLPCQGAFREKLKEVKVEGGFAAGSWLDA